MIEVNKKIRDDYFNMLQRHIHSIMITLKFLPDNEEPHKLIEDTTQLASETFPICSLTSAIYIHGYPLSLIFINQAGIAIDLLKVEELNQESAFDELFDNMKIG